MTHAGGRPRKKEPRKYGIYVSLSKPEIAILTKIAEDKDLSRSAFIRHAILPYIKPHMISH